MTITTQRLLEQYTELDDLQPDLDKGIIPNVKVLGIVSRNGYRYTEQALHEGVSKIEGVPFYWNHVKNPADRKAEDYHGNFRDARYIPGDGWRANLHYIKEHARTPLLLEIARASQIKTPAAPFNRLPALSPDMVTGLFKTDKRGKYIDHIEAVKSVDLVAFTGTTSTLQESHHMETTWQQIGESLKTEAVRKPFLRLLEELGGDLASAGPAGDSADAHGLAWIESLLADGSPECKTKAKKVFKMLLAGGAGDTETNPTQEALQVKKLERKAQVLQECLDADYKPSPAMLAALTREKDPKARKQLIQESAQVKGKLPRGPRSQGATPPAAKPAGQQALREELADLDTLLAD